MIKYISKMYKNSKKELFLNIKKKFLNKEKMFIVTANPETIMSAKNDKKYSDMLLDQNTTIIPDSIGIIKAGNILNVKIKEKIPGVTIVEYLLEIANEFKKNVYFFGSKEQILHLLDSKLKKQYPNLKVVGMKNGYYENKDAIFNDILKVKPDIIIVALGIPLQENLIYKYYNKFDKGIFIGVGGSLDVISGYKKRAPKIFQKTNLEWLYRIIKEPKRLKRFYKNNIKFIFEVKKEKRRIK